MITNMACQSVLESIYLQVWCLRENTTASGLCGHVQEDGVSMSTFGKGGYCIVISVWRRQGGFRRALIVAVACCRRWARAAGVRQSRGVICKRRRRATCPSASCIRRTKWSCCWTRSASWSPPAAAGRTYRYSNFFCCGIRSPNCGSHLVYRQGTSCFIVYRVEKIIGI